MRLSIKLAIVALMFLFNQSLMASADPEYDLEAMPLQPIVPQEVVVYVNPPEHMQGEIWLESVENANPMWINLHRSKVRSKVFKVVAAMTGCLMMIAIITLIGIHDGPTHLANATNYTGPFPSIWPGGLLPP